MRIVVVHHALDWGGSARAAVDLANHWARTGHEIVLPALGRTGDWHYPLESGIEPVELTQNLPLAPSAKIFVESTPKLRRLLRRAKPDAVVSIGALPNFAALASNAFRRSPVILSERADPRVMAGRRHAAVRNGVYRLQRQAAMVMLTEEAAAFVRRWLPAEQVYVIPNPAPDKPSTRPPGGIGSNVVVAVGRLVPQKGFDMLLDAWASLVPTHPGWRLRILGEGTMRAELEAQSCRLDLTATVEMPGFDPQPFAALAASDVYAFSSRYEGFAHVLVEAMACGVPVVAMDGPSGPHGVVRDGVDGLITPPLDIAAFAWALGRLMSDSALREAMARRALEARERFHPDRIWAKWDHVLHDVVTRAKR